MTREQQLELLVRRGITRTRFETVRVEIPSLGQGVEIGQGKCLAVILHLNRYVFNATDSTDNRVTQMYYGDRTYQEYELLRGQSSEIIFCRDLSEVFIRSPWTADADTVPYISLLIYDNEFLDDELSYL